MTPSTEWKEVIPEGEAALHERLGETMRGLQRANAKGRPAWRGLHTKANAGLRAELEIAADVPEYAKVGIFAKPGKFQAFVRVSNGTGRRQDDARPDVRGFAIKVLGVPGKKLIPGLEDATTQDFLLIRSSSQPFRRTEDFVHLVQAARTPALLVPKLVVRHGFKAFGILKRLVSGLQQPFTSAATTRYFSALPTRFGAYAVRWDINPAQAPTPDAAAATTPEFVGEDLSKRLASGSLAWDLRAQFFKDERTTPIEDASKDWSEADAPYVTLARLTVPQQDTGSEAGRKLAAFIETLSFDPWHAPVEFRPLGEIMRARNVAYRHSTQERGAAKEPDGSETFTSP